MIKKAKKPFGPASLTAAILSIILTTSSLPSSAAPEVYSSPFSGPSEKRTETLSVAVGGMPFGVKLKTEGPVVAGFSQFANESGTSSPAQDAGLEEGDVILKVGGTSVTTSEEVIRAIQAGGGETEFTVRRDDKTLSVNVTPKKSTADGKYRVGLLIRDAAAGIGTVTFLDPETGAFMGLGHGVCDPGTGELVPLLRGVVCDVEITGSKKGEPGEPGELTGRFLGDECGVIKVNSSSGVFGFFTDPPECDEKLTEVGERSSVRVGEASIISTVSPGGARRYSIEIENVPKGDGKNFEIKVTDPALLETTGGIVQGMSGSPIIQDGKLVGAVTHVMINDSTRGYGIYVEEMLAAAEG